MYDSSYTGYTLCSCKIYRNGINPDVNIEYTPQYWVPNLPPFAAYRFNEHGDMIIKIPSDGCLFPSDIVDQVNELEAQMEDELKADADKKAEAQKQYYMSFGMSEADYNELPFAKNIDRFMYNPDINNKYMGLIMDIIAKAIENRVKLQKTLYKIAHKNDPYALSDTELDILYGPKYVRVSYENIVFERGQRGFSQMVPVNENLLTPFQQNLVNSRNYYKSYGVTESTNFGEFLTALDEMEKDEALREEKRKRDIAVIQSFNAEAYRQSINQAVVDRYNSGSTCGFNRTLNQTLNITPTQEEIDQFNLPLTLEKSEYKKQKHNVVIKGIRDALGIQITGIENAQEAFEDIMKEHNISLKTESSEDKDAAIFGRKLGRAEDYPNALREYEDAIIINGIVYVNDNPSEEERAADEMNKRVSQFDEVLDMLGITLADLLDLPPYTPDSRLYLSPNGARYAIFNDGSYILLRESPIKRITSVPVDDRGIRPSALETAFEKVDAIIRAETNSAEAESTISEEDADDAKVENVIDAVEVTETESDVTEDDEEDVEVNTISTKVESISIEGDIDKIKVDVIVKAIEAESTVPANGLDDAKIPETNEVVEAKSIVTEDDVDDAKTENVVDAIEVTETESTVSEEDVEDVEVAEMEEAVEVVEAKSIVTEDDVDDAKISETEKVTEVTETESIVTEDDVEDAKVSKVSIDISDKYGTKAEGIKVYNENDAETNEHIFNADIRRDMSKASKVEFIDSTESVKHTDVAEECFEVAKATKVESIVTEDDVEDTKVSKVLRGPRRLPNIIPIGNFKIYMFGEPFALRMQITSTKVKKSYTPYKFKLANSSAKSHLFMSIKPKTTIPNIIRFGSIDIDLSAEGPIINTWARKEITNMGSPSISKVERKPKGYGETYELLDRTLSSTSFIRSFRKCANVIEDIVTDSNSSNIQELVATSEGVTCKTEEPKLDLISNSETSFDTVINSEESESIETTEKITVLGENEPECSIDSDSTSTMDNTVSESEKLTSEDDIVEVSSEEELVRSVSDNVTDEAETKTTLDTLVDANSPNENTNHSETSEEIGNSAKRIVTAESEMSTPDDAVTLAVSPDESIDSNEETNIIHSVSDDPVANVSIDTSDVQTRISDMYVTDAKLLMETLNGQNDKTYRPCKIPIASGPNHIVGYIYDNGYEEDSSESGCSTKPTKHPVYDDKNTRVLFESFMNNAKGKDIIELEECIKLGMFNDDKEKLKQGQAIWQKCYGCISNPKTIDTVNPSDNEFFDLDKILYTLDSNYFIKLNEFIESAKECIITKHPETIPNECKGTDIFNNFCSFNDVIQRIITDTKYSPEEANDIAHLIGFIWKNVPSAIVTLAGEETVLSYLRDQPSEVAAKVLNGVPLTQKISEHNKMIVCFEVVLTALRVALQGYFECFIDFTNRLIDGKRFCLWEDEEFVDYYDKFISNLKSSAKCWAASLDTSSAAQHLYSPEAEQQEIVKSAKGTGDCVNSDGLVKKKYQVIQHPPRPKDPQKEKKKARKLERERRKAQRESNKRR